MHLRVAGLVQDRTLFPEGSCGQQLVNEVNLSYVSVHRHGTEVRGQDHHFTARDLL